MPGTRLILHIGTHKTGSTYLQSFLHQNRGKNLRKYGTYYPRTDHTSAQAQKNWLLPAAIRLHCIRGVASHEIPEPAIVLKALVDDIHESGADTALISAEGLSRPSPVFARECRALSHHFDVAVVIFLRRQDLFVESLYKQFIRDRGETRSLAEFVDSKGIGSWLDYRGILGFWEAAFGREAINVILFEQPTFDEGLIETLSRRLGLALTAQEKPRRNVSPGREVIEVLRRLNQLGFRQGMDKETNRKRNSIVRAMRELGIGSGSSAILSRAARKQLLHRYQDGNAEIASRYLGRSDGILFLDDIDHGDYPSENWSMTDEEVIGHLARITCHLTNVAVKYPRGQVKELLGCPVKPQ